MALCHTYPAKYVSWLLDWLISRMIYFRKGHLNMNYSTLGYRWVITKNSFSGVFQCYNKLLAVRLMSIPFPGNQQKYVFYGEYIIWVSSLYVVGNELIITVTLIAIVTATAITNASLMLPWMPLLIIVQLLLVFNWPFVGEIHWSPVAPFTNMV